MSPRAWHFRIDDMLQALAGIAEDIDGLDYQDFVSDRKTRNSVLRELEVVGEAARQFHWILKCFIRKSLGG